MLIKKIIPFLLVTIIVTIIPFLFSNYSYSINNNILLKEDSSIIRVNKKVLVKSDILIIFFRKTHPSQLAIKSPNGDYFFLAASPQSEFKSLYSSEEFLKMKHVYININNLKLYPYVYNSKRKKVFQSTGFYEIQLSENLEEDFSYIKRKIFYKNN